MGNPFQYPIFGGYLDTKQSINSYLSSMWRFKTNQTYIGILTFATDPGENIGYNCSLQIEKAAESSVTGIFTIYLSTRSRVTSLKEELPIILKFSSEILSDTHYTEWLQSQTDEERIDSPMSETESTKDPIDTLQHARRLSLLQNSKFSLLTSTELSIVREKKNLKGQTSEEKAAEEYWINSHLPVRDDMKEALHTMRLGDNLCCMFSSPQVACFYLKE